MFFKKKDPGKDDKSKTGKGSDKKKKFVIIKASEAAKKQIVLKGGSSINKPKITRITARDGNDAAMKVMQQRKIESIVNAPDKPPFKAYKGSKHYIFVSYSHRDKVNVYKIISRLNDKGYRLWYDEGIEPGNEWPEEVGKALSNCGKFLVFISPDAVESRNVRNEINMALSERKDIVVVLVKTTELSDGLKLQIGTLQHIVAFNVKAGEFFEKLEKKLVK